MEVIKIQLNSYENTLLNIEKYPILVISNLESFVITRKETRLDKKIALILFPISNSINSIKTIGGSYISKIKNKQHFKGLGETIIWIINKELLDYSNVLINSAGLDRNDISQLLNFLIREKNNSNTKFNLVLDLNTLEYFKDISMNLSILEIDRKNDFNSFFHLDSKR